MISGFGLLRESRTARLTGVHSSQHIVSSFIALEHIVIDHLFVAFSVDLLLEEEEIVMIIPFFSEIFAERGRVLKVLHYISVDRLRRTLIRGVALVLGLDVFC